MKGENLQIAGVLLLLTSIGITATGLFLFSLTLIAAGCVVNQVYK